MSNPRKSISNPPGVPAPLKGYYSNAVKVDAGPLLFISGQVSVDENGEFVGKGDIVAQTEQCLKNIETILKGHGGTMDDVVKFMVYCTDFEAFKAVTPLRLKYFPENGPASAMVQVASLITPDFLIEIEAVAVVN